MRTTALLIASLLLAAAGPPQPRDWPCVQRLVPTLSGALLWPDFNPLDHPSDPQVTRLAAEVTDRLTPDAAALASLQRWAADHPAKQDRADMFAALVDATNTARGQAIEHIRAIDRRLQGLKDANDHAAAEQAKLPADAPAAQLDDLKERRAFILREYDAINRTVRYACEIPPDFETRLGKFARILQGGI